MPCRLWDQFHYFASSPTASKAKQSESIKLVRVFLCLTNMRILRDHVQHSYPPEAQHSRLTVALILQLWNEWEIQCLVLVSFSLQVFLLFFAGFRKRYRSSVLSVPLWLAYLSADTVAVFVLGRLTRVTGDDTLLVFWAPFMLLHLGGQETITAFSMEDCALWKRHLLNLTTQVALAIYVVGKQWRGDKQLVAPMVLIFISGMAKYVERIWILGRAGSWAPGSTPWGQWILGSGDSDMPTHAVIRSLLLSEEKSEFNIEELAINLFSESMKFIMNMTPRYPKRYIPIWGREAKVITSSDERVNLAYKLVKIQLSLIYDHLYTKFGGLKAVFPHVTTLVLTSTALALFVVHHKGKGRSAAVKYYSESDVAISYILLLGAEVLEISSILMWLMSSHWSYMGRKRGGCSLRIGLSSIVKRHRPAPEGIMEWSGKLQQYNLVDDTIQEKKASVEYGWLKWLMWRMGIKQDDDTTTKHVVVSLEVKKVFLEKLCEIATGPDNLERLAFTSFRAEELATQQAVSDICKGMDLVSSALLWHLVTDICLASKDETLSNSKFRTCSQHLSNYIMHLVYQCNLLLDTDGRDLISCFTTNVLDLNRDSTRSDGHDLISTFTTNLPNLNRDSTRSDGRDLISGFTTNVLDLNRDSTHSNDRTKLIRSALQNTGRRDLYIRMESMDKVILELLRSKFDLWEMITMVWVEMLFYIARNCDHGFHAKQLSAGGEFLTHAKMLLFCFHVAIV